MAETYITWDRFSLGQDGGIVVAETTGGEITATTDDSLVVTETEVAVTRLQDANANILLWMLNLPWADVSGVLDRTLERYHVKLPPDGKDMEPLADAIIGTALRGTDPLYHKLALAWVRDRKRTLSDRAVEALRDFVEAPGERAGQEDARRVLEAWRASWGTLGSRSQEDLRQFVRDYLSGAIYTSADMNNPEDIRLVFMPLALGALAVPEAMLPWIPPLPPAPSEPKEPEAIPKPKMEKEAPKEPEYQTPNPSHVEELEFRIRWGRAPKNAVKKYLHGIETANEQLRKAWQAEVDACNPEHILAAWKAACAEQKAQHAKAVEQWQNAMETWRQENAGVLRQHEERKALEKQTFLKYVEQIGVFFAYMKDAAPRSVNGMPMFFSVSMLNVSDWGRCRAAIIREVERQKEMIV